MLMDSERLARAGVNEIFGAELPQESSDERELTGTAEASERERWLRENVPPHHI
jgi:hypothetical protein